MEAKRIDQEPDGWSAGAAGYEENFARFTRHYSDEMLDALGVGRGSEFLDVAAGTGATSIRAAERGAIVTATDFAAGMVAVAARRLRAGGHDSSVALEMDGQALDLRDDSFDAAASMFGLMFFPDTAAGTAEMRRCVRPGGRVGLATWDLDGFPMHRLIGGALQRTIPGFGTEPPPAPTWAALGTTTGLADLLRAAGLSAVDVRPIERRWHFDDPAGFFRDMPSWSCPVRPLFDALPTDKIDEAAAAFAELVADEGGTDGDGIAMRALFGTATVP